MSSVGLELRFRRALEAYAREQKQAKVDHIAGGKPTSWEEYRECIGFVRAMDKIIEACEDIERNIAGA